ncbi:hypothetical protein [Caballeronia sp. dw_19]|uniref:hypothetical protein n=1 Tax=Caballeronia sp. dw_19 TaxID=2719791 RepID=UPI001BD59CC8|nr:hypothetical protein [Caballeronia sp. dw_19]
MIEWLGLLYTAGKDLKEYLVFSEEQKQVDNEWLEKSGLKAEMDAKDIKLAWSQPDRIASRQTDGWEVVYEVDKIKRIRRKLVRYDGTVLIKKQEK